jgi:hypothetical protein
MKLAVIKEADVIIAVSPSGGQSTTVQGKPVNRDVAPFTGIAPLPRQKLFAVDVPDQVARRIFAADRSESIEDLLRSYPLADDAAGKRKK